MILSVKITSMKFRNLFTGIIALMFLAIACNKIESPYLKPTGAGNGGGSDEVVKTILIEEFTGHQCPNCPRGAAVIENIAQAFPGRVIVVAVHAGFFARPSASGDFTADYRTPAGTELDNYFKLSEEGLPRGMVNRIGFSANTHSLIPEEMAGVVNQALQQDPVMGIKIINNYQAGNRQLSIKAEVTAVADLQGEFYITVYLTENGIVSPQKNLNAEVGPTPTWYDYTHNHLLRSAINGTWGEPLSAEASISNGITITKDFNLTLNENWKAENCEVIVLVHDNVSKEILQAAKAKVQ
jgi:thiol-disulfide isomerase/thioredoxin